MRVDPSFWVFMAFLSLVFLIGRQAWQKIRLYLDQRAEDIHTNIKAAQQLKDEAQMVLEHALKLEKEMNDRSNEIIVHGEAEIHRLQLQAQQDLDNYLSYEKHQLLTRQQQFENQAIQHIKHTIVNIAFEAAQHAIKNSTHKTTHDLLFNKGIAEISRIPCNPLSS